MMQENDIPFWEDPKFIKNHTYKVEKRIEDISIKSLKVGILVSNTDYPSIVACLDGTFRLWYPEDNSNLPELHSILLFEDMPDDNIEYVISIDEFDFFSIQQFNHNSYNREQYDSFLYDNCKGLCVHKEALALSKRFILDHGSSRQFVIYCKNDNIIYADCHYTEIERLLIVSHFNKPKPLDINEVLIDIDRYINQLDVDSIIESFTIENEEIFICRPGKDDYYYVDKVSKLTNDEYINSLLPKIREQVYKDSGYCEAHRMSIHPTKRAYSEEESKYIADAKLKYDKDAHRRWLIRNKINEFIKGTSAIYQDKISIIKAFTQEMDKLIKDENINRSFVKEHNKFLRDSIRKAHDYKFAGYYSKD